jgi:hypothetical protein
MYIKDIDRLQTIFRGTHHYDTYEKGNPIVSTFNLDFFKKKFPATNHFSLT